MGLMMYVHLPSLSMQYIITNNSFDVGKSLHFDSSFQEMSVELSLEDVKKVAFHYGFELEVTQIIIFSIKSQINK